jgi:plasmid stabilization system protein ParE
MTQPYEIIWAGVAENDLKDIVEYIAADSPAEALNNLHKIEQKVSYLSTFPEQGRLVPELHDQGILIYRELILSPWRIIYRIAERKIYILAVLDARRNIEDILLRRLILNT